MKRIALCLVAIAVLVACPKSSEASDLTEILRIAFNANHHRYRQAAQRAHVEHHVDLQAREIERQFVHQAAHQQPLTNCQHDRLHNELDRSAYQDASEHDVAHATGAYATQPYGPRLYQPRYGQSYQGVPYGYGAQYGTSQYQPSPYNNQGGYGVQYGSSQYQLSPYDNGVGRLPYGRY